MSLRYIYILIILTGIVSCKKELIPQERIDLIEKSDFEIFKNVNLQASEIRDNKYTLPFFSNQVGKKKYLLPNFKYFNCENGDTICLNKATNKKFDLIKFGHVKDHSNKDEAYQLTLSYIDKVVSEYDKVGAIYKIFSNESLGGGIIFYYEGNNYVAYIPDVLKVPNENWKKRFTEENKIKDKWYKGNW